MFKKGQSGNPAGKKPGTKNKNYLDLNFWFGLVADNINTLTPEQQIEIGFKAADRILGKVQNLPGSAADSANNGRRAFELMNGLAPLEPLNPPLESKPESNGGGSSGA